MILQKPRMTSSNQDIYGFNPYGSVASIFQDNLVITRAVEAFLHHQNIDKHLLRWLKTFSWKMYPTHSLIFHENVFNYLNIKRMKICIFVLLKKKHKSQRVMKINFMPPWCCDMLPWPDVTNAIVNGASAWIINVIGIPNEHQQCLMSKTSRCCYRILTHSKPDTALSHYQIKFFPK